MLQAGSMGHGGGTFVLDMGEPVKIVDLARDLVRLSGLPEESIDIRFSGVRPGEKLFEELVCNDESLVPTSHGKVHLALGAKRDEASVEQAIESLLAMAIAGDTEGVLLDRIQELIPGYSPDAMSAPLSDGRLHQDNMGRGETAASSSSENTL